INLGRGEVGREVECDWGDIEIEKEIERPAGRGASTRQEARHSTDAAQRAAFHRDQRAVQQAAGQGGWHLDFPHRALEEPGQSSLTRLAECGKDTTIESVFRRRHFEHAWTWELSSSQMKPWRWPSPP